MTSSAKLGACLVFAGSILLTPGLPPLRSETPPSETANAVPTVFAGLGDHGRTVTTGSTETQKYFNQGLAFLYGFNHDEAIRLFEKAAEFDPECAMVYWAIAYANGPHINFPVVDEPHAKAAWQALLKAREHAAKGTEVERDLIEALGKRYFDPQPEDRKPLDEAYASVMRVLWKKYPDDADVGALFAESLMDLRPWDLWRKDGKPQPGTEEVMQTLETVLAKSPNHPLALHLYIHAAEASPNPEQAGPAADRLRNLQPGLGHMVHMPSHIDVRLGRWQAAIEANEKAIKADAAYRKAQPQQNFFRLYMAHNHHMLAFAAMMQGQSKRSREAISNMIAEMPEDWLTANAPFVDAMLAMPYELHMRFGRWDEMLSEAEPRDIFPIARTVRHYARGVSFAAKSDVESAKSEQAKFLALRDALPKEAMFTQNTAADVLAVAENMLKGEILFREGKVDESIAALREAVRREDALRYIEPPDWIQPVRHALGATLVESGRYEEAAEVYRDDLKIYPENGWSLYGLAGCLRKLRRDEEADRVSTRFEQAWQHADVKLTSSCYCLPGK